MNERDYTLRELIRADIEALRAHVGSLLEHLFPSAYVVVSYRLAHALNERGHRYLAGVLTVVCQALTGAEIKPEARIGPGMVVIHSGGIIVEGNVVAGRGFSLWGVNSVGQKVSADPDKSGSPVIGDHVVLMTHASILGPIKVGNRVLVGAYSLVLHDMPDDTWPRGVPARAYDPPESEVAATEPGDGATG